MNQYGLKNSDPAFQQGPAHQITPDEIDRYEIYNIIKPSIGTASIGTASGTAASLTLAAVANPDYPRNLLLSPTGQAGTIVITGKNQFGEDVTETLSAAAAATDAGTVVFATVTSGAITKPGSAGTIHLGVAAGTASDSPIFGLPFKVGGTADVKRATWIDNGAAVTLGVNGAAPSVNTVVASHSVRVEVSGGIAIADDFVIWAKPTYDASSDTESQAGL